MNATKTADSDHQSSGTLEDRRAFLGSLRFLASNGKDIGARDGDIVPPFVPQIPPTPPSTGANAGGQHSVSGTGTGTGARQRRPNKPRCRFVTYVAPDGAEPAFSTDPAGNEENRETADAGVRRVRWFEESQGRVVTVMPQNHPGYDIESRSAETGDIERYIEVKSCGGAWDVDGVGMTVTEFNKARELGNQYWLYVVDWATSDQPDIHRIQDPARKANWFFYDHGWSQAAES